jgi:glutamate/tyrosine decarboxylase-like PLP-dependent enzyme
MLVIDLNFVPLFNSLRILFRQDVFPDVRKMAAEVVRMVCRMFHGDDESCGTVN